MTPQNYNNQDSILEEALKKFVDAHLAGDQPDIHEFVKQYPDCEDLLRQRILDLQKINNLFDSLVQADESDFDTEVTGGELIGEKIRNFEIVEIIGQGGMGVVYLAHDTKLKRSVAIKCMPVKLAQDSASWIRFRREAELLASLNHPNIAIIYEIIEQKDGSGYLVLEYVPGETLAERIAREPLKFEEALSIAQQIAEAASAAHKKGIVHRDLKPANIKITPEGRVKVLDFGLAKPSPNEGKKSDVTATEPGRVIGTPAYMSPEQARGKNTDYRTDIWSFGCIMYEMLTGKFPFEGETATDTLARIIEREPDWELLPKKIPTNIRTLLQCCLQKDPDRRLGDIAEAAVEINETLRKPTVVSSLKLRKISMIISTAAICIILFSIVLKFIPQKEIQPSSSRILLVVLPFENLGSTEDEYFADGIAEEIMSRLSTISSLGVISRTSAIQYKNSNKTIRQIGQELGVEYVLEGTVRWDRPSDGPSRVRVTPQLIRIPDDTHLWSDRYDAVLTNIFEVQSDIAERVAQALDITLIEPERQTLAYKPTENMEAYDYYLQGNYFFNRSFLRDDYIEAIRMYQKAVDLDPAFALAYAQLSIAHSAMYWYCHDRNKKRVNMAKEAVNKAFDLNPELPEIHIARGLYYYHCHLDYDRALEEFAIAEKRLIDNFDLQSSIAWIQRRQGKFEQAVATMKKTLELDPRSEIMPYVIGETFMLMRKYEESEQYLDRAILLAPDWARPYAWKVQLNLTRNGNIGEARAVLENMPQKLGSLEDPFLVLWSVRLNMFDRKYKEALSQLSSVTLEAFEPQFYFIPKALLSAQIYALMGNNQLEEVAYNSALDVLKSRIEEHPEDGRLHSSLGIVYAGLDLDEEAVREGLLGVTSLPVSKEAYRGTFRIENLARIYVMVGKFDAAIDQLQVLLEIPSELSPSLLRLDPVWDPLRDHPRFKRLIESDK